MSAPFSGSIAAAGVAAAVVNNLSTQDLEMLLEVSGNYQGATLVFEALPVGGSVWFPVAGVQKDTLSTAIGTQAAPYAASPDGVAIAFRFDLSGCSAFRVWAAALTAGPIAVQEVSGSFFANPPSGAALSLTVLLAVLWQMAHLTFLVAQGDEKAAAQYVQNPIFPAGLAASVWRVNF